MEQPLYTGYQPALADKGQFNGLTFHRFVANFVIQGGSPGADEVDGATSQFLRDEVGLPRHLRGTLGISTRGHDTGDGQIFVNLVDNFRLDDQLGHACGGGRPEMRRWVGRTRATLASSGRRAT